MNITIQLVLFQKNIPRKDELNQKERQIIWYHLDVDITFKMFLDQ